MLILLSTILLLKKTILLIFLVKHLTSNIEFLTLMRRFRKNGGRIYEECFFFELELRVN
jgi:hypothetical protein